MTSVITEWPELSRVLVRGAVLQAEVQQLITAGSLSWSTTEVTQMSLTVEDPGFQLWHSGLFTVDATVSYRPTAFKEEIRLRISAFDLGGGATGLGGFTVKARSEIAWLLKRRTGAQVVPNVSATEYIFLECWALGPGVSRLVAQPTFKRPQVARDVPEPGADTQGSEAPSSWTTFQRLADEENFLLYEFAGTVYFGSPAWLMANLGVEMHIGWGTAIPEWNTLKCPSISLSQDSDTPVTVSGIEVRPHRVAEALPGRRMMFHGIHPFIGAYLITSMTLPMMGTGNLQLTATRPDVPPVQPPSGQVGQTVDTANAARAVAGGQTVHLFVSQALSQTGKRYAYGAQSWATDNNPSSFDTAELIQWSLARCGIVSPEGPEGAMSNTNPIPVVEGLRTRGALLYGQGRVAISLGDGRVLEARPGAVGVGLFSASDTAWARAGRVKGLEY